MAAKAARQLHPQDIAQLHQMGMAAIKARKVDQDTIDATVNGIGVIGQELARRGLSVEEAAKIPRTVIDRAVFVSEQAVELLSEIGRHPAFQRFRTRLELTDQATTGDHISDVIKGMKPDGCYADLDRQWADLGRHNPDLTNMLHQVVNALKEHETAWIVAGKEAAKSNSMSHVEVRKGFDLVTERIAEAGRDVPLAPGVSAARQARETAHTVADIIRTVFEPSPLPQSSSLAKSRTLRTPGRGYEM